jgi:hypothetical protein
VGKHAWWRAHLMQSSTELDIERSGITTRSQQTKTESVARKCRRCDCAPHLLDQADVAVLQNTTLRMSAQCTCLVQSNGVHIQNCVSQRKGLCRTNKTRPSQKMATAYMGEHPQHTHTQSNTQVWNVCNEVRSAGRGGQQRAGLL